MTNDTRTADDIERDIKAERARMSGTINDLQKKFSAQGIVSDIGTMFRDQGGDVGRAISDAVGRNPAAVALVGVGLAWLILGKGRDTADGGNWNRGGRAPMPDADDAWFDDGGMVYAKPADQGTRPDPAANAAGGLMATLRQGADSVYDAVSGAASAVRDTAKDLNDTLARGTEGLPKDAMARVMAARRAAHDARDAAQKGLKQGSRAAANLFEDQPLVVGALALALGAAVGGLLPHTRVEDETLGANSDRMFDQAQKVFRQERDKAVALLKAAANEAEDALNATEKEIANLRPQGRTAGNGIADHTADTTARVPNMARDAADLNPRAG